jgi:hypothetical protein
MREYVASNRARLVFLENAGATASNPAIFVAPISLQYWRLAGITRRI